MNEVAELAHAKINLTLDVLYRRNDGYHEVEMVMQSVELADKITMRRTLQGLRLFTSSGQVPQNEENLAWKAAKVMFDNFKGLDGLEIVLDKRIPVAAGLAGGSADAAAVIRGINRLWQLELSKEEMARLAAKIGSDVPFCIYEGTALAKGRGELLTPLSPCPPFWMVLVKPVDGISTAQVYANFKPVAQRPDTLKVLKAIEQGNRQLVYQGLGNVLESVTFRLMPEVGDIKREMLAAGARNALMSGSGSTVIGFVDDKTSAEALAQRFFDREYQVIVTRIYP